MKLSAPIYLLKRQAARQLKVVPHGTVVVIDYLQILDQDREKPILKAQVSALKSFAKTQG